MHFSVWPTTRQPWSDILDIAVHAERSGWDGLWLADHFLPPAAPLDRPTHEGWSALSALAVAVPRIRLGTLVLGNTYRHPAVVANMAASLDHISGGRLVLGLGAGWQQNEHTAYGIELPSIKERLERFSEACEIIRSLLTEERTTYAGRYYQVEDAPLDPKPLQKPLPILVGGGGEKVTLRIAARFADEWNTWGAPDILAHKNAVLDDHCHREGRDPASLRRSAQAIVIPEAEGVETVDFPGAFPVLRGSADALRDAMRRYADAGVDEFILPDWNTGSGPQRRHFFDWFAEEVAAPFR